MRPPPTSLTRSRRPGSATNQVPAPLFVRVLVRPLQNVTEHNPAPSPSGHPLLKATDFNDIHQIFTPQSEGTVDQLYFSLSRSVVLRA